MNINILRYSLFGIAGDQKVDHNFCKIYYLPSYNDCTINLLIRFYAEGLRNLCFLPKVGFSNYQVPSSVS